MSAFLDEFLVSLSSCVKFKWNLRQMELLNDICKNVDMMENDFKLR